MPNKPHFCTKYFFGLLAFLMLLLSLPTFAEESVSSSKLGDRSTRLARLELIENTMDALSEVVSKPTADDYKWIDAQQAAITQSDDAATRANLVEGLVGSVPYAEKKRH